MDRADRVREIVAELRGLGYYPFQIEEMIEEIAGTKLYSDLEVPELDELVNQLQEQLDFAWKCKMVK